MSNLWRRQELHSQVWLRRCRRINGQGHSQRTGVLVDARGIHAAGSSAEVNPCMRECGPNAWLRVWVLQRLEMKITVLSLMAVGLAVLAMAACGTEESGPRTLYDFYQHERESNPTRLAARVAAEEMRRFSGHVTNIDGPRVQFHPDDRLSQRDRYIECRFAELESVSSLDTGQYVTLYGKLVRADRIVVFDDCTVAQ